MPILTFFESQTFHIPAKIMIARCCHYRANNTLETKHRNDLTLTSGVTLAGLGIIDFCIGVHLNFQHLTYPEYQGVTTFVTEFFKAYLLVNMFYRAWLNPRRFRFLSECIAPLAIYGFLDSSQQSGHQLHALRPFLIGLIPDVAAALNDTEELAM